MQDKTLRTRLLREIYRKKKKGEEFVVEFDVICKRWGVDILQLHENIKILSRKGYIHSFNNYRLLFLELTEKGRKRIDGLKKRRCGR